MKKTIKLATVLFKSSLSIKEPLSTKKQVGKYVLWGVLAVCIAPLIYFLYNAGYYGYLLFEQNKENDTLIGAVIFIISAGICLTGIAACINSMYFANNNNALFVMPLKPTQIAGAKLIVATIYEYYLSIVILAPFLIGYGIAAEKSALFWVAALIAVILLPIVPMAYAGIISLLFMQLFKGIKGKGKMPIISAIAIFLFSILTSALSRIQGDMSVTSMEDVALHVAGVLKKVTMIFPDVPFISSALTKEDFLSVIIAIAITALVLVLFWVLAKAYYFSAAIGRTEKSASRKTLGSDEMNKFVKPQNILKSYTLKELRMLSRDPSCFMQCFLITLGWPVLIIATSLFSSKAGYEVQLIESLVSLSGKNSVQFVCVLFAVVFAVTLFGVAFNAIAPTCISREGKGFMLIKQLPIPYKTQLRAKRNAALVVSTIGSGAYLLIGGIILIIMKGFPWWGVLLALIMNFLIMITMLDIQMIIGLKRAKLDWESESDIMGKNIPGVMMFFIGLACLGGMAALYAIKLVHLTMSPIFFGVGVVAILIILACIFECLLYWYGPKKMEILN